VARSIFASCRRASPFATTGPSGLSVGIATGVCRGDDRERWRADCGHRTRWAESPSCAARVHVPADDPERCRRDREDGGDPGMQIASGEKSRKGREYHANVLAADAAPSVGAAKSDEACRQADR